MLHTFDPICILAGGGFRETDGTFDPTTDTNTELRMGMAAATGIDASGAQTDFMGLRPTLTSSMFVSELIWAQVRLRIT